MKKTIIVSAMVMMIAMSFSSCKKDWSCLCTDQSGNTTSTAINDQTLLNARDKCKNMDYSNTTAGVTTSESCSLQ
jgi:hypothetical protein